MMDRPSFQSIYMSMAESLAQRGTCIRLNSQGERMMVGAVITTADFSQVLSVGYNGNARGLPNCCDSDEPGKCGCIHAELNAIIQCRALAQVPKVVFCTHLPCPMCSKYIIQLGGVSHVYFARDYRIRDGLKYLEQARIKSELWESWRTECTDNK